MASGRNFSAAVKILRYAGASAGPVAAAATQFGLSVVLLRTLAPNEFGAFSFLSVTWQFSAALWSALFCGPLPVLIANEGGAKRQTVSRCLLASNLALAVLAFVVFACLGKALEVPPYSSILFAGYASLALVRWFARSYAYAVGRPFRTMISDLIYTGGLLAGITVAAYSGGPSLQEAFGVLLIANCLGLLPFGSEYLSQQFVWVSLRDVRDYAAIWRQHSSWSLFGVVTTEATANAHVYIVTSLHGPSAFAPIAASAMIIRPIQVAANAFTEFERASMAREIGAGRFQAALDGERFFRRALIAAWAVDAIAVAVLAHRAPELLFPRAYPRSFLVAGGALWMTVLAIRLVQTPASALLQAAGEFRTLAFASAVACGVSVTAVTVLLKFGGTLWSIMGIVLGEAVFAGATWTEARRWYARQGKERVSVSRAVSGAIEPTSFWQ